MLLTERKLKQIIKEEIEKTLLEEGIFGDLKDKFAGSKLGQKMGMQTNKQKSNAEKEAYLKKLSDASKVEYEKQASERTRNENEKTAQSVIKEFPKEIERISLTNKGGDSRLYIVDIEYKYGGKNQHINEEYQEIGPGSLYSIFSKYNMHPSQHTIVNDKNISFNRGGFEKTVKEMVQSGETFQNAYQKWQQKFAKYPEALQIAAQKLQIKI